ncbi:unnamed protein product [Sordaria macrospora k-hell]|uniref:WGS project CABT00000000 data, contig 2.15 n=1 Tax=Sordaria macrospora (strain ATCC MYA-333 / DSM 997 / K(L3346) / K-hell) TaxID=771870 RepID=F7VZB8_SORMK|nr:uncharacterized protein SMAC_04097 [Sordaria macrospora k-hell]CCC10866.1 unnamed protein product [Sordaria macrospora k-hell]
MVTRKPLPANATLDPAVRREPSWSSAMNSEANMTWNDEREGQQRQGASDGQAGDVPRSLRPGQSFSNLTGIEDDNVWADNNPEGTKSTTGGEPGDIGRVPTVLRPGGNAQPSRSGATEADKVGGDINRIPTILRPGGSHGHPETNPFKKKMPGSTSANEGEDTIPAQPAYSPPVPPVLFPSFSNLSISEGPEQSKNPWQPSPNHQGNLAAQRSIPDLQQSHTGGDPWRSPTPSQQPAPGPSTSPPTLLSLPSDEDPAKWDEQRSQKAPELLPGRAPAKPPATTGDDWNLIDIDTRPGPPSRRSTWEDFGDDDESSPKPVTENNIPAPVAPPTMGAVVPPTPPLAVPSTTSTVPPNSTSADEPAPPLPERRAEESAPELPPRSAETQASSSSQQLRQVDRSETYQIKRINWYDATAETNPRTSPILIQNANGPCPLLALVNALILSTPAHQDNTVLVETLRSREQVSLGLLIDAVFDELMSERRLGEDAVLPDITELYNFLQSLHTGMNVNPRFVPTKQMEDAFNRTSLSDLPPTERSGRVPGTFEKTREMRLYSTFSVPLIHGWLPPKNDSAYGAFERQAASYDDAQNLMFREEELEAKLSSPDEQGLTENEQQMLQDIFAIKDFWKTSGTQLTTWGLDVISSSMKPGAVAILFRNDHFTTLYKHPQTGKLMTLVTDAGYATHDEIVWESLVDVNGERAEFFSGDFRPVGGASHDPGNNFGNSGEGSGWTTVQGRRGRAQSGDVQEDASTSPSHEQEDHDLALALQLQEEEEQRHREEQDRRRRERELSEQFIEQQARTSNGQQSQGHGQGQARGGSRGGGGSLRDGRGGSTATLGSQRPAASASRSSLSVASTAPSTRRSNSSVNVSANNGGGASPIANRNGARTSGQTVRSLIPPLPGQQPQPFTNRAPDDGVEDAPPSYDVAATQAPYIPPEGHPSHPSSSPTAARADVATGPGAAPPRTGATSPPQRLGSTASSMGLRNPSQAPEPSSIGQANRPQSGFPDKSSAERPTKRKMTTTVGLIDNWYPPTRENYDLILSLWKWFPVAASIQWATSWYGMGKTSVTSRLNLPGRIGWLTMEAPGFMTLLYMMRTLPAQRGFTLSDLPWQNKVLAGLFVIHYSYRAIAFPFLQPSMAPMHIIVWLSAFGFQIINGTLIGSWLAAYGPTSHAAWAKQLSSSFPTLQFTCGIALFYVGLMANYYHDDELREIRRRENRRQERLAKQNGQQGQSGKKVEKHYEIPKAGLFK